MTSRPFMNAAALRIPARSDPSPLAAPVCVAAFTGGRRFPSARLRVRSMRRYSPAELPRPRVIGWIGSAENLNYWSAIAPALTRVVSRFPHVEVAAK